MGISLVMVTIVGWLNPRIRLVEKELPDFVGYAPAAALEANRGKARPGAATSAVTS
jgi:hypothetical protein